MTLANLFPVGSVVVFVPLAVFLPVTPIVGFTDGCFSLETCFFFWCSVRLPWD